MTEGTCPAVDPTRETRLEIRSTRDPELAKVRLVVPAGATAGAVTIRVSAAREPLDFLEPHQRFVVIVALCEEIERDLGPDPIRAPAKYDATLDGTIDADEVWTFDVTAVLREHAYLGRGGSVDRREVFNERGRIVLSVDSGNNGERRGYDASGLLLFTETLASWAFPSVKCRRSGRSRRRSPPRHHRRCRSTRRSWSPRKYRARQSRERASKTCDLPR